MRALDNIATVAAYAANVEICIEHQYASNAARARARYNITLN
jgi:hypothetical protein